MTLNKPLTTFPAALSTPDAQLEPFDWFREQRSTAPIHYDPDRNGYDVFTYEVVRDVFGDHETFSSDPSTLPGVDLPENNLDSMMLYTDPPRHDQLRSTVDDFFTPGAIHRIAPQIETIASSLLDDIVSNSNGEFKLVQEFAGPLPVLVIATLLGIPPEDHADFQRWSTAAVAASGRGEPVNDERFKNPQKLQAEMHHYFEEIIEKRRANPQNDLVSRLAGSELTTSEILGFCELLLIAGNITTTKLIANAVWSFAERPSLFNSLRDDEDALKTAVEEVLRYRSPSGAFIRYVTCETTLAGTHLTPGDQVVVWIGAANRDPAIFDNPETFNPGRNPNPHMAFGHGIHHCLGASLARLEAQVALDALLNRFEGIHPDTGTIKPSGSLLVYGANELTVEYNNSL